MFLVILLYALFASLFGLSKATLEYSDPFFLIGSRMAFAGCLMFIFQFIRDRKALKIPRAKVYLILLLGFFNIYLTNIAEIWGLSHMISAKACLIYSLSPFLSALFSFFIFSESLSYKQMMALCIGFLGLGPCFFGGLSSCDSCSNPLFVSSAELVLLVAVISSVCGWIFLRKLVWEGKEEDKVSFVTANAYSMMIGGSLALVHSYLSGEIWNPFPVSDSYMFIRNTIFLCIISNLICYNLYGYLLKHYSATLMSFAGLVTPLFASLFGWVFLGEVVDLNFFLSFALFSVGLFLFHQEEFKKGRQENKEAS